MGLPGYLSFNICFGPSDLDGLSMQHGYTESGIGKLMLFIRHWRSDSQAGRLSRVLLAWVQALTGTSFSVLRHPSRPLPHLEEGVEISYLRRYLSRAAGHITLDQDYVTPLQQIRNTHLMDAVLDSGHFTPAETCLVQYCRLFFQVRTVSDIADSTRTHLKDGIHSGTLFSCSSTRLIPTIQARPNSRAWRTWRLALPPWANKSDRLTIPLGDWSVLPEAQRFHWTWYACGISIFTSHGTKYRRFSPICSQRNYYDYLPQGFVTIDQLPILACPCDVILSETTSFVAHAACTPEHTSLLSPFCHRFPIFLPTFFAYPTGNATYWYQFFQCTRQLSQQFEVL
jgi:hypothetical protein